MCGLTGFVDFNKQSDKETVSKMTSVLHHRGPDDAGLDFFDQDSYSIGLGHKRLSILDLSALGHQPYHYEHLSMVYNGEIYNFKEVRAELEKLGETFVSDSDTEVIIKSFARKGLSCVEDFIGMFAISIWDKKEDKIYLIRDRAGVKPLYYYWKDNLLLFSSELKSFHEHPNFQKESDQDSVSLYLQYSYIPAPYTIFKNCWKLKPGHTLVVDLKNKDIKELKYWDVNDFYNKEKLNISEGEAIEELESIMKSAFDYRMVSDVPVGVFLSGGYDSSAVAALLQKDRTDQIHTFTIGFQEDDFNEAPYAKKVADYLGTKHTEYYCTPQEAVDIIPKLPDIYDEPFGDNSVIPTVLVSELARKHVTVALSADGGDEIFAGYPKFHMAQKYTQKLPAWSQYLLSRGMDLVNPKRLGIGNGMYNFNTRYDKIKNIWKNGTATEAMKIISQFHTDSEMKSLIEYDFNPKKTYFDGAPELMDHNDDLNKMLAIDYKTFLLDNNLTKVDRATMSVSLEGREPLLDHRIIEYVSQLPSNLKTKDGVDKYILKTIVHKHLPTELMERKKMGFVVPIMRWFKDDLKDLFIDYLNEDTIKKNGIFNAKRVLEMRDSFLNGKGENVQKLWHLLLFQMWKEKWD